MDAELIELKKWLDDTRDVPLEAMDAFFNRRVGGYEDHMSPWRRHYAWLAELLPENTAALLDIGCGTGLELDEIFRRFPDLSVTGVDLSREMLAELSRKHADRRLALLQADYFRCELGEACFDAAVAFETLHHFPAERKRGLFARIFRSLRPGGVWLECDYIAQTDEIEALLFRECARRRTRDGIAPEAYVHFDTPLTAEHELAAMREAGFTTAEVVGRLPGDVNTVMFRAVK